MAKTGWRLSLAILAATLILALGCIAAPTSGTPSAEQPDDIVFTPGGIAYRANVYEQGVANPWPPIQSETVVLADNFTVTYRDDIETKAGQTRNNIVAVRIPGHLLNDTSALNILPDKVPTGIKAELGTEQGGLPGTIAKLLVIEISNTVKPGQYSCEIGIELEGKGYGKVPCRISVVQG